MLSWDWPTLWMGWWLHLHSYPLLASCCIQHQVQPLGSGHCQQRQAPTQGMHMVCKQHISWWNLWGIWWGLLVSMPWSLQPILPFCQRSPICLHLWCHWPGICSSGHSMWLHQGLVVQPLNNLHQLHLGPILPQGIAYPIQVLACNLRVEDMALAHSHRHQNIIQQTSSHLPGVEDIRVRLVLLLHIHLILFPFWDYIPYTKFTIFGGRKSYDISSSLTWSWDVSLYKHLYHFVLLN